MKKLLAGLLLAGALSATPAFAGNIVLTGHDNDFHFGSPTTLAGQALNASVAFVRNGSALPVLTFDSGIQLTSALTALGIPFFNVDPNNAALVTDALFNPSIYSAFAVASISSCGGCDNSPAGIANIATHSAAITAFFNAGGGIYGLAGAADPNAYAYVPEAASNAGGSPPSSGFVQTADGAAAGIPAVNGNATHNFFSEPGTGGLSSAYRVFERLGSATTGTPETIGVTNGRIVCTGAGCVITPGTPTPEPASMALLGVGLLGFGLIRRRLG